VRRILITSINAQEGKSFVAANLAVVFAQAGKSVALLDCDLHRPTQHRHFNRANRPGLSDSILQETFDPEHVLFTTDIPNLRLLTAGALPPQPAELLGSHKMGRFLDAVAVQQDFIVIDSPPIAALTDAAMLAKKVDGVVLVVEAGKTNASDVRHAKEQLERSGAHIIGVVLNKAPVNRSTYYHYHYSSYYNSTYGEGGAREPDLFRQPVFYVRCFVKKLLYRRFSNEKEKLRHSERS
jgi:capsular exopolysaccharide synthesis family protein